jgi:hypothetical protein
MSCTTRNAGWFGALAYVATTLNVASCSTIGVGSRQVEASAATCAMRMP